MSAGERIEPIQPPFPRELTPQACYRRYLLLGEVRFRLGQIGLLLEVTQVTIVRPQRASALRGPVARRKAKERETERARERGREREREREGERERGGKRERARKRSERGREREIERKQEKKREGVHETEKERGGGEQYAGICMAAGAGARPGHCIIQVGHTPGARGLSCYACQCTIRRTAKGGSKVQGTGHAWLQRLAFLKA